jgi:hypothetical protein
MTQFFNDNFRKSNPEYTEGLLSSFKGLALSIHNQSTDKNCPWKPPTESIALLNHYIDILWSMHISKFDQLCQSIVFAKNNDFFLQYGLAGRSLIEHAAVMRYYFRQHVKPIVDQVVKEGVVKNEHISDLIQHFDRLLRAGNFDWALFLHGKFEDLLIKKKPEGTAGPQVRVGKCIELWAKEKPMVSPYYQLFCDLVHPNIGSSFLVMQKIENGIGFGKKSENSVGEDIFMMTLPGIVTILKDVTSILKALAMLTIPVEPAAS